MIHTIHFFYLKNFKIWKMSKWRELLAIVALFQFQLHQIIEYGHQKPWWELFTHTTHNPWTFYVWVRLEAFQHILIIGVALFFLLFSLFVSSISIPVRKCLPSYLALLSVLLLCLSPPQDCVPATLLLVHSSIPTHQFYSARIWTTNKEGLQCSKTS